jgi:hypothetical protein
VDSIRQEDLNEGRWAALTAQVLEDKQLLTYDGMLDRLPEERRWASPCLLHHSQARLWFHRGPELWAPACCTGGWRGMRWRGIC